MTPEAPPALHSGRGAFLPDRQVVFRGEKVVDEVDVKVGAEVDANHPFR